MSLKFLQYKNCIQENTPHSMNQHLFHTSWWQDKIERSTKIFFTAYTTHKKFQNTEQSGSIRSEEEEEGEKGRAGRGEWTWVLKNFVRTGHGTLIWGPEFVIGKQPHVYCMHYPYYYTSHHYMRVAQKVCNTFYTSVKINRKCLQFFLWLI